jgi:hypothetical protein
MAVSYQLVEPLPAFLQILIIIKIEIIFQGKYIPQ